MEYRAVGNRIALVMSELRLPIADEKILQTLLNKGFTVLDVDIIALARSCVGVSTYKRGARVSEAPAVVDCSGFVRWLFAERGIWLPRRSIQQREAGEIISLGEAVAGDLVFTSGSKDYYLEDKTDGVGHVGFVTDVNTVIHASNQKRGVVEDPLERFVGRDRFRGARRYLHVQDTVLTLEIPPHRLVETTDDLRWIVRSGVET